MKAQGELPQTIIEFPSPTDLLRVSPRVYKRVFFFVCFGLGIEFSLPLVEQRRRSRERPHQEEEEEEEEQKKEQQ